MLQLHPKLKILHPAVEQYIELSLHKIYAHSLNNYQEKLIKHLPLNTNFRL